MGEFNYLRQHQTGKMGSLLFNMFGHRLKAPRSRGAQSINREIQHLHFSNNRRDSEGLGVPRPKFSARRVVAAAAAAPTSSTH